ncbi:helix-turn-helix domain-containing protein [Streptomyces sp. SM12]|uniref:helix-turn-helix domain-containing protein n=1 Tax=Streptomyces sp. SM12 TaxID=1071602 RepID=UPI000CD5A05C|nr:helix-turn-helix domain-containing protein [Streptomyces sp. SM12]
MYQERPSDAVPGAVAWWRAPAERATPFRVLPDGCMDLIWRGGLLVAGPDTRAQVGESPAGAAYDGIRLPPGTGPGVFGLPAHELRDQRVGLDSLWPDAEVRELAERVAAAPDRSKALAEIVRERRRLHGVGAAGTDGDGARAETIRRLVLRGALGGRGVADTARAVGLSERQLHRRCRALFGYGAKTLERVLRMRRALELVGAGVPAAEAAARAGYADQPHLAREVRELAGVPLSGLAG